MQQEIAFYIGWTGNLFFIIGAFYIARKHIKGQYCQIYGNGLYLLQSMIFLWNPSLAVLSLILIVINLYGIINWIKNENK